MAHKKGQGSSRNGRDSNPQFRGVKIQDGELVLTGNILVRQVGSRYFAGRNVGVGRDWTLYSRISGRVKYETRRRVSVYPSD